MSYYAGESGFVSARMAVIGVILSQRVRVCYFIEAWAYRCSITKFSIITYQVVKAFKFGNLVAVGIKFRPYLVVDLAFVVDASVLMVTPNSIRFYVSLESALLHFGI